MDGQLVTWGVLVAVVLVMVVGVAVLARRRRASRALDREEQLRLAKRAAQQIAKERRRTGRGNLRGKGGGGSEGLSHDAAYGSEGGTPGTL
jgi:type II secretory pathway pseudopilin PulG